MTQPKILVSDKIQDEGLATLRRRAEVDVRLNLSPEDLLAAIGQYDAIVVRSGTKVTGDVIKAGRRLRVIGRAGVGVDNIDVNAATRHGVVVVNSPVSTTVSVAEHTIGLMLALARHIPQADASLRRGLWQRSRFRGTELFGKTLGVVGLGRIGSLVAMRARGLGMTVVAHDPYIPDERAQVMGVPLVPLEDLFRQSDYITIHTPLMPTTHGLISDEELSWVKPTARLINCARGGIVDEAALLRALEEGRLAGAALDVYAHEPPTDSPLLECDRVVLTPHLGASTSEAQVGAALDIAQQVLAVLDGQVSRFTVNPEVLEERRVGPSPPPQPSPAPAEPAVEERPVLGQEVLLGNGAIARGLVEAGCHVVASYPGTPSSEIVPEVVRFRDEMGATMHIEWSVNEKVAFEVALAAAWAGKRAAVVMKQVGLNVAADPLMSSAYTGVKGGFVIISCDDPGPHSSQTEQDTRFFGMFAKVPVLDPSSPREARDMVGQAFELSERYRVPVILRPAIRVCHARQNVALYPRLEVERRAQFDRDPGRWAATPRFRYVLHKELNDKLRQIETEFASSPLNETHDGPEKRLGFIAAGVSYPILRDTLREMGLDGRFPILKMGTSHPLPHKLVSEFMARCDEVLVLEEPDAVIEFQIRDKSKLLGRLNGAVPNAGELTPEVVHNVLTQVIADRGLAVVAQPPSAQLQQMVADLQLPVRKPRLCPGCPHRAAFYAIRRAMGARAIYPSDIGCYTLGINLRAVDTVLDMGAAVTLASGFYQAYRLDDGDGPAEQPIVATIGDSTFIHSGVPALINAAYNQARMVLVILDNAITAMTGMQPTPDSGILADGRQGGVVRIVDLVKACGVGFVEVIDPYRVVEMEALVKRAYEYTQQPSGGVAVIIARRPCVIYDPSPLQAERKRVDVAEECDGCLVCIKQFECPALVFNEETGRVEIDRRICVDCGVCVEACRRGYIQAMSNEQ